jgi:hypothetical protein
MVATAHHLCHWNTGAVQNGVSNTCLLCLWVKWKPRHVLPLQFFTYQTEALDTFAEHDY